MTNRYIFKKIRRRETKKSLSKVVSSFATIMYQTQDSRICFNKAIAGFPRSFQKLEKINFNK